MTLKATMRIWVLLITLATFVNSVSAQTPTYELQITNETQVNPNTYQFDVYIKRTGANPLELANFSAGIAYDISILNGGTPTFSIVSPGSTYSELNTSQQPSSALTGGPVFVVGSISYRYMNIQPRANPGAGNGTIISATGTCPSPGTRVGRFQLSNSVPFATNTSAKHIFSTAAGSGRTNTVVSAYVAGSATVVTNQANHFGYQTAGTCLTNITLNPPAPCDFDGVLTAQTNVSCFGGANGSATITLSGVDATSTGSYTVDGGASQPYTTNPFVISGLSAGAHNIVVTNSTALCTTDPIAVTITEPASALSASVTSQTNVLCFGQSTGSVTITATGGTAPYTGDGVIGGLAAGSYNLTVTDANGCTFVVPVTITEPASAVSASASGQVNVLCNGASTGSVTISGSGGTAPYTGEGTFTGLAAGTYNYTVTDANGCTDVVSVTITEPSPLVANESHTQAACGGFSDVTITGSGGTAPYTGEGVFQLAAGATQTYTVTDANGCTAQVTVTATVPGGPSASITAQTNVSCFEGGDGSATVTASGGLAPYTYSWSPSGGTGATATGLAAGTYTVTVTDANNCSTTATATITEPADLTGTTSQTNVSCFGGSNGSATVTATGGTGAYSYLWSPSGGTAATATGLAAGSYSVTVTDANGCTETFNYTITEPASAVDAVASGQVNVSCFGGSNGSVTISGAGGTAPYTGEGTFSGLAAGTYNYTVTDANGCTDVVSVTITEPAELVASESHTAIVCGGTSTVTISATGGTAPYTGTGTFAQTAGTQNYTVTDALGCTDVVTVTVVAPGGPTATITAQTNVDCNGNSTGSATVTAADGLAPYTYSWSPSGGTAATATGLAAGTYTVTVTDANNCSTTATVTITEPAVLVASSGSQTNVSCFGGSDGSVVISATGGTAPYTGTGTFTGLAAGTYNYTVTDFNGCTDVVSVTITEPSVLNATSSQTNVTCNGGSDGTATITATGGTGPYTGTGIFTGLAAGTYNYTVTDINGCTDVVSVTITEPAPVPAPTYSVTQPDCFTPTGTITVTSPTAGLSFSINGSDYSNTSGVFTGVLPGTYSLTAKDGSGCVSAGVSVTVDPQPATPPAPGISVTNNGNGTFTLTATGFTGTLLWNTAQTSTSIIVSPPGTWTVTQTVGGCTSAPGSTTLSGAIVADPAVIGSYFTDMADATINANIMTFGTDYKLHVPLFNLSQDNIVPAGSSFITINLGSKLVLDPAFVIGTSPLNAYFTWTSSVIGGNVVIHGEQIANIPPDFIGEAVFNVEGSLSCAANVVATWTVDNHASTLVLTDEDLSNNYNSTQYGFPVTISATPVDVTCTGANNGSINWVASPGTSVVVRNASNQVVTAPFGPGTYTVTATGNNDFGGSCSQFTTVTISEPATAVTATASGTNVSCFNGTDGTATAIPAGGTAPYTYSWNTVPAQTTITATGLSAGTYTVTVTDANGCSAIASYTVTQPTALTATASGTNVNCFAGNNGTATVVANGGTPSYTYSWNTVPAQTTATATGLAAGTYTVTVTDANGCSVQASYTVTEPATGLSATASGTNVDCFGNSTGTASASPTGGTAPYSYVWNSTPAQTTQTATGLPAGIYTVTITDANGCTTTATYEVTQSAAPLSATASGTNVSCFAGNNGSATVVAAGGTAPYTYSWNTVPVQMSATATNLVAGTYTVTVTDANGCTTTASYTVTQPTMLTSTGSATNVSCNGLSDGTATVIPSGGTAPYTYVWNTVPAQTTATATGLAAGTYSVTITDANGCVRTQSFSVTQPAALATTANITNVTCNGLSNGSATVIVTGGTTPYSYVWNTVPAQTTATASGLAAGSYSVTVTDANGCSITATYNVTEPAVLAATAIGTNVACYGNSTGTATALPTGGTAPYSYSWNTVPAQTTQTATGLAAGTYTVTITDANGCTTTASYEVTQSGALLEATATGTNVICFNAANGTATVTATGGTTPYSYSWNTTPVQTTATATGLAPGTYTVTVTDANGCTTTASYTVTQPVGGLSVTASGTPVNCFGNSTGTATANPVDGTAPYTYSWNTVPAQTTQTATGLAAGTYTVTVTDANGCSASASYTVTQPSAPLSFNAAPVVTNNPCNGGSVGSISVSVAGGTTPYAYSITGGNTSGASTGSFTGLAAGSYVVTVTDAVGCILSTSSISISQPSGLYPDITLGSDYTANFFASNGVEQTILYNVAEIGGNPAIGDTIRIIKPSGYTFSFDNAATSIVIGGTPYTLDNTRWKLDNSNPAYASLILDPFGDSQPGVLNCGQLVRVTLKITRNTPNLSTFTLSSRLRRCGVPPGVLEQNLSNNLNSIIFTAE